MQQADEGQDLTGLVTKPVRSGESEFTKAGSAQASFAFCEDPA
jgi:hypothetical protein